MATSKPKPSPFDLSAPSIFSSDDNFNGVNKNKNNKSKPSTSGNREFVSTAQKQAWGDTLKKTSKYR